MKNIALVVAAGSGSRMASGRDDKPFLELKEKPIIIYTLSLFDSIDTIDSIVLVVKDKYVDKARELVSEYGIRKVKDIVAGGDTRGRSVRNGINAIEADADDLVLIHDGVRPFASRSVIQEAVESAKDSGASVVGFPCTSTIKNVGPDGIIKDTPERNLLWEAQTPQVFRYGIIKEVYSGRHDDESTDDSVLVERRGHKVRMIKGERQNIKITTEADLRIAEAILMSSPRTI